MKNQEHLFPHFNDGKMARFTLRANSLLILGGGGGGGLIFHFNLSKVVASWYTAWLERWLQRKHLKANGEP